MRELVRTTDPVLVSWLEATLRAEGIESFVLDLHMSVLEGSIGLLPRRVMVAEDDFAAASLILRQAQDVPDDD
ncbi:MAG: DUF2007 domain-containing protein [Rhodospirillaceae bacterium]|nr:DUF2007 domain-containing protein [Rhodospirillaceae bacterium]